MSIQAATLQTGRWLGLTGIYRNMGFGSKGSDRFRSNTAGVRGRDQGVCDARLAANPAQLLRPLAMSSAAATDIIYMVSCQKLSFLAAQIDPISTDKSG